MALNGVKFDYVNSNPEVGATDILDPSEKLYFNVGIDDKFGFEPDTDWKGVSLIADYLDDWKDRDR